MLSGKDHKLKKIIKWTRVDQFIDKNERWKQEGLLHDTPVFQVKGKIHGHLFKVAYVRKT